MYPTFELHISVYEENEIINRADILNEMEQPTLKTKLLELKIQPGSE